MAISKNEAQSRIQINKMLELSGWDLDIDSEKRNVEVEYPTPSGREADYVLLDKNGFPLCVLEAKNFETDPLIAKEQARDYAQSIKLPFYHSFKWKRTLFLGY